MDKIYVIYWSGTGNTKAMAHMIEQGIKEQHVPCEVLDVSAIKLEQLVDVKAFALGCPSMGAEQLEEYEMEPFVGELDGMITGKHILLFGSYGWGDCEWMRDWEERLKNAGGIILDDEGITVNGEPDSQTEMKCLELGGKLAKI